MGAGDRCQGSGCVTGSDTLFVIHECIQPPFILVIIILIIIVVFSSSSSSVAILAQGPTKKATGEQLAYIALNSMLVLTWGYSKWYNKSCGEYVRYSLDECVILTKAWNKWTDNHDGSLDFIVEFESTDNNTGSPVVVRGDLKNIVPTTSANNFKAARGVIIIQDDEMSAVADRSAERFALGIE